jgi:uncharacterized Zn-binding protein involved in type VI secretion
MGSPDVMIADKPAARAGDMAGCLCPLPPAGFVPMPAFIVSGSPTVSINDKPAARLGDNTNHGGIVMGGCPTVLIDDPPVPPEMYTEEPPEPKLIQPEPIFTPWGLVYPEPYFERKDPGYQPEEPEGPQVPRRIVPPPGGW